MPKQLPYMKWHCSDAENDEAWRLMSFAERGLYMTLLDYSWMNAGLPPDSDDICRAVGARREEFDVLWVRVSRQFPHRNELGRLVNGRQERDRAEAVEKSQKCTDAIRTRYERRYERSVKEEQPNDVSSQNVALRASESVSVSESVSESVIVPGKKKVTEITERETAEFEAWVGERLARHNKKTDKYLNQQALTRRFARDPAARREFEANHDLWVQTPEWRKSHGSFAPKLWQWIEDDAWKWPPARDEPDPKRGIWSRMLADERAKAGGEGKRDSSSANQARASD